MKKMRRINRITVLLFTGLTCGSVLWTSSREVWAETIELVTYYPAPSTPDLHLRSLTVGTQYATVTPNNGQAFIYDSVGIGTTSPLGPLHVVGFNDQLSSVVFEPGQDTGAAGVPDLRVGIGSGFTAGSPPTQRLEVKGNVYANGGGTGTALFMANRSDNVNFYNGLQLLTAGAPKWTIGSRNDSTENFHIYSDADSAIRLSIQQGTGNVGIGTGTTAPAGRLHVVGPDNAASSVLFMPGAGTGTLNVGIGVPSPETRLDVAGGVIRVTQDVNSTTPQQMVVRGQADIGEGISVGYNTTGNYAVIQSYAGGVPGGNLVLQQKNPVNGTFTGKVGIGKIPGTPTDFQGLALDVQGDIRFSWKDPSSAQVSGGYLWSRSPGSSYGGKFLGLCVMDGDATSVGPNAEIWIGPNNVGSPSGHITLYASQVHCNSTLLCSSDARLKSSIAPIPNALERVCSLRGVNFRWKDPGRSQNLQMGVIGQEVEKVFPELVNTNPKDGMKEVSYLQLSGALIEAVKQLKAENDTLRGEVKTQRAELEGLKARFENLR